MREPYSGWDGFLFGFVVIFLSGPLIVAAVLILVDWLVGGIWR